MLKLKNLLQELTAAEKAKQLGYTSAGFDKWEKDGKVVARTVNGELVPVQGDEGGAEPKPTTMSAKDAGTKPSNVPQAHDAAQTAGKETSNTGGQPMQGPPPVKKNPYAPKPIQIGRPLEDIDIEGEVPPARDPWNLRRIIHPEEEAVSINNHELLWFLNPEEINGIDRKTTNRMADECALTQHIEWRSELPKSTQEMLSKAVELWQNDSASPRFGSEARNNLNATLNIIANGKPPAILHNVQHPIERGMTLHESELEEFLKQFSVGEDVEFPPSGFSFDPNIAREFASSHGQQVGVLLRLAPNRQGQLYGIALNNDPDRSSVYDFEREIIRPSGPKAVCRGITKFLCINNPTEAMRVTYVIDLEEQGTVTDNSLAESYRGLSKKQKNPIFEKIMNTSFGACKFMAKRPIQEGAASDKAHELGLEYHGYGYWSKNGEIVAKTVDDQLVKVSEKDKANKDKKPAEWYDDDFKTMGKDGSWPSHLNDTWLDVTETNPYTGEDELPTKGDPTNILFKKYKNATGTNPGGFYLGKDNVKRYVKFYEDPAKSYGEVLANNLYHDLGIDAPESQYFQSGDVYDKSQVGFASVIVSGDFVELYDVLGPQSKVAGAIKAKIARQILSGFCADILCANWDVVGVNEGYMRNILIQKDGEGTPVRIDNGSAFLCRGLNGRKADAYGEEVLYGIKDWGVFQASNPSYAELFQLAGVAAPDLDLEEQMMNILNLCEYYDGWENYVAEKIPDIQDPDKTQIIKMLYHRTKLMIEKVQGLTKVK